MNESSMYMDMCVCVCVYNHTVIIIKSKFLQVLNEAATMWHNPATFIQVVAIAATNCAFRLQKIFVVSDKNEYWFKIFAKLRCVK